MKGRPDYIVVGAGSAGAPLATRLSQQGHRVLLLEAGPSLEHDFWVKVPIGIARIVGNAKYVWPFYTEPQHTLAGQRVYWPRGRLPGGSSSVNGALFVRGDPTEFDFWSSQGNTGWSYEELLPYFKRLEHTKVGDDAYRGRSGPISITSLANNPDELSDAFLAACDQGGVPRNADYNGANYEGASYLQLSTLRGQRSSTAMGYLHGIKSPSLTLETEAVATRILFDGLRAVGVEYIQRGERHQVYVNHEIILSAGPIKSPQLLELSGIGDTATLAQNGVSTVFHLPGVGENLIDHLQSRITLACTRSITLNEIVGRPLRQAWMGAKYLVRKNGIMTTPGCTVHALAKTSEDQSRPTVKIQLHHLSGKDRFEAGGDKGAGTGLDDFPGFSVGFFQLRPTSRGSVHIKNSDPFADPEIQPRYLAKEEDRAEMIRALKLVRKVLSQSPIQKYIKAETRPGPNINADDDLLDYIKTSGQTSFHPVGTCKMGTDPMSVVGADLKVHGIKALRIADSSIMPTMASANTNAASIMIGEKAADLITSDTYTHNN
ncbi:MAG: GMC family oxidoreductase N-terminal domain-containing protein [Burkholderiaceae bacterium]|nr:GMC family oxidoreductase N-terminal domain-containing protein [Burkholderiaceae bacterium]